MIEFSVSCVEIPAPKSLNERVNLNWTKAFIPLDKSKPLYWPALACIYALDQSIASKHLLTALSKGIRSSVSIISIALYFICRLLSCICICEIPMIFTVTFAHKAGVKD